MRSPKSHFPWESVPWIVQILETDGSLETTRSQLLVQHENVAQRPRDSVMVDLATNPPPSGKTGYGRCASDGKSAAGHPAELATLRQDRPLDHQRVPDQLPASVPEAAAHRPTGSWCNSCPLVTSTPMTMARKLFQPARTTCVM